MSDQIPHPPYDELRTRAGEDPAALAALEELRAHLHGPRQEPATVRRHVGVLRGVRTLEAIVANWWDDPRTQLWIKGLTDAGL